MKQIAILGSTGSIGTQTLDVIRRNSSEFQVTVLAANSNDELLEKQIHEFNPRFAILSDESAYTRLKSRYSGATEILGGRQAFIDSATVDGVEIVVTSMTGFAGLEPTVKAIQSHKTIALANKETLVVAGEIITRLAREYNVKILPVDSIGWSIPWKIARGSEKCNDRSSFSASNLEHGQKNHGGFSIARQQRFGSHRGKMALRC